MKFSLKPNSLPALLLRELALWGAVLYSTRNPYAMVRLLGIEGSAAKNRQLDSIARSVQRLRIGGYVDYSARSRVPTPIRVTPKGKHLAEYLNMAKMKLPVAKKWDGLWRMVIFDIPDAQHGKRIAFQTRIKSLGFKMIQRSVWAYPYECRSEIEKLEKFYEIEKYVAYLEVSRIDGISILPKLPTVVRT